MDCERKHKGASSYPTAMKVFKAELEKHKIIKDLITLKLNTSVNKGHHRQINRCQVGRNEMPETEKSLISRLYKECLQINEKS